MTSPLLSIVIVSYNTRDILRRCLASVVESPLHSILSPGNATSTSEQEGVAASPQTAAGAQLAPIDCEIIVVDNASPDASAEMVSTEFPQVRLIREDSNLGFARATNVGLDAGRGDLLLLLNPDTEVLGDALPAMVAFLDGHHEAGAVSPALVYPDGSHQHAAFHFPTLWMSFFDFFPINHRFIDSGLNGRYPLSRDGEPFPVDHPLGAAMMIRRETLQGVGMLDEEFFMYCEEVDWCIRARRQGWRIYQIPTVKVVHHVGQSSKQFREEMLIQLHRSRYRLFEKHYSGGFIAAHRAITRLGLAREMARARWEAGRGRMSEEELSCRLRTYQTIWGM